MASWEEPPLPRSFDSVFYGAAGGGEDLPSDDQFNRVSFLSHFEGSNNGVNNAFEDGSGQSRSLSNYGSPTQGSFGPFALPDGEWGVSFDGDGDYLQAANSADWDLGTGNFTWECYANINDITRTQWFFSVFSTNSGQNAWGLRLESNGTLNAYFSSDGGESVTVVGVAAASSGLTESAWHHIACVKNGTGSNNIQIYVDGVSKVTGSFGAIKDTNLPFRVGRQGNDTYAQYFLGQISNIRIIKGTALYTGNFTPSTSKLTAVTNTKLLTCQSNRFVDNSASAHTVTPSGNAAVTSFGPFLTSKVYDATVNGASSQFGATNSVEIATGTWAQLGTGDFTWEYWIYPIVENNYHLGSGTSGQNLSSTFTLGMSNKQLILYYTADGTAAHLLTTSGAPEYNLNEWHHLAYVRAGNVHKIYANGILATSETRSGAMANSTGPTIIGQFGTGSGIYGYGAEGIYCDVRLVKGTAVYSGSTYTVPTAPLTAISNTELLLNFKNGQAIDSAAQNNLTLYGTAKTSTAQYKFGTASLLLDGNSDYAVISDAETVGGGDFTIELWARRSATDNGGFFQFSAAALNSSSGAGPGIGVYNGGIYLYYGKTGALQGKDLGGTLPGVGTWFHVAYVRSSGVIQIYVDGTAYGSTTASTVDYTDSVLTLGGWYNTNFLLHGNIDDFRISHMARYTSNFTAPSEPFADKGQ